MKIQGGLTGLVIGSPKTGKSAFLGSIAEVEGIESPLLLTARPREVNSFKYRQHDIPYEIFSDKGWHPIIDKWEATDYKKLHRRIVEDYLLWQDEDIRDAHDQISHILHIYDPLLREYHYIYIEILYSMP